MMNSMYFYDTPIGLLTIAENGTAITQVAFGQETATAGYAIAETPLLAETFRQLQLYFDGGLRQFDLPLALEGTDFQKDVWAALTTIPYGETRSYGQIAQQIGRPKACRAVGGANHHNPISIIIPCHRVIGANGTLTGYGGGLDIKEKLLRLEGIL